MKQLIALLISASAAFGATVYTTPEVVTNIARSESTIITASNAPFYQPASVNLTNWSLLSTSSIPPLVNLIPGSNVTITTNTPNATWTINATAGGVAGITNNQTGVTLSGTFNGTFTGTNAGDGTGLSNVVVKTTYSFSGNTAGKSTWHRPVPDGNNQPYYLSVVSSNTPFQAVTFRVTSAGNYDFLETGGFDSELFLYFDTFNSSLPLTNVLIGNDEFPPMMAPTYGAAGFTYFLNTNTDYIAVITGYEDVEAGAWTLAVSGYGSVSVELPTSEVGITNGQDNVNFSGTLSVSNITASGTITGNGSGLTNILAHQVLGDLTNVTAIAATGNATIGGDLLLPAASSDVIAGGVGRFGSGMVVTNGMDIYPSATATSTLRVFSTNSTPTITVNSNRAGINRADPQYPLHVVGTIYSSADIIAGAAVYSSSGGSFTWSGNGVPLISGANGTVAIRGTNEITLRTGGVLVTNTITASNFVASAGGLTLPVLTVAPAVSGNNAVLWVSNSASPVLWITTTNGTFAH